MTLALTGDLVVAVLLILTIVCSALLNRRLAALRHDQAQLQALIESLGAASESAAAGIATLKAASEDIGRQLEAKAAEAETLRDDLAYMMDRGGALADRLEATIRAQREPARREAMGLETPAPPRRGDVPPVADGDEGPSKPAPGTASRAERNLLRALAGRR